ncbi:hypothetical protein O3G_MSEX014200 [Manduca sexta]|uniref:PH domain-containing protein n=2 Tax=Manduca sexta TaxID=7130 RepID=A0A921ZTM6_MANSE|nr:hypothetical protein O3G_MSEX014200 [Manduca sexta]
MRHVFLFDKMLLVTKNREDGILAYKSHIMCNDMMLVESIAGAPLSFHVIPWEAPRAQLTLQARSHRHKREWTLLLKRVILENYNAVIPSHARQLVMELGQNKTDDDMLAEKSHNLITQASMRKQLSAPEYLEKRKLERERRKSFENGVRNRLKKANRKYTIPNSRTERQDCDCTQVSAEKGTDYTCENCYIDLCSDCETELSKKIEKCPCRQEDSDLNGEKCPECVRSLHYIDAGSAEHLERKPSECKCSDFKSSQESFGKEFSASLTNTRGYHSSDNIVHYSDSCKSKEDLTENNSLLNVRNIPKTCLKCAKIKENIVVESVTTLHPRRSRCNDSDKHRPDTLRSKSKDDPQRSKLTKIGTWRRKSEPGLQQNSVGNLLKKAQDSDGEKNDAKGNEKIEFECRNCGSNKITKKIKSNDGTIISDPELDGRKRGVNTPKGNLEIRMYNTKNIPKKISKIKKNRAKGLRLGSDTTAKFYADFSTDVSTENILHISESTDSLNVDKPKDNIDTTAVPETLSKDEDIDEETYKKLIEKTDSFKKNELEKVKYLNKQKVINEGSEAEDKTCEESKIEEVAESCEEAEQPLEQIISQLLMQNREFQKLIKKQQQRNSAQRRHQRLMKSHSNPEPVVLAKNLDSGKLKPKHMRQTSENLDLNHETDSTELTQDVEEKYATDDDHIYETLRVDDRVDESLHNLNSKSKIIQHSSHLSRPKRLPSPPNPAQETVEILPPESDYVYLTFDQLNKVQDDGIYDVPVKSPKRVDQLPADYYVTMEKQGPAITDENIYDTLLEVCKRKKDVATAVIGDYLPMSSDQQSPNTPEIWLSRQKEHFNVSRDRKSGSLPRSFQVVTSTQEENNLSTFKCKPNSNSKTYLNRDGKVMSIDRPFTIASDQSEISYDDVENYMSEGDILKFNKNSKANETDYAQNISQSTLELEEEIDRCYKSNFEEINLDKNKNENIMASQGNLNNSTTSSCEVLTAERIDDKPVVENIHPEHKIYKPTSNMLSLKNVLSRFKNKTPNKNNEEGEINANEQSSPDSTKSDTKSPTNEKRSALNPRSYSKNLLQRFRSIIGDDTTDDNQNKAESTKTQTSVTEDNKNVIKVVITSTDASPTTSTIVYSVNSDMLSKSVCEHTSLTDSQNEKNNLEALSLSCDNITKKTEKIRPSYEKSISMVTSISSAIASPLKSNNSSYQSLNKLPIYMQGSKLLGARIAQSDYVDPMTLSSEKAALKSVNVLINKNAVRPDSLFSNSSFVTTSSEGVYQESKSIVTKSTVEKDKIEISQINPDESYYEKSFEKIEQVTDEDVFRDSAVYSDQEDEEAKPESNNDKTSGKTVVRTSSVKRKSSFKVQNTVVTTSTTVKTTEKIIDNGQKTIIKTKIAPPVPVKPKITQMPVNNFPTRNISKNNLLVKSLEETSSTESISTKTIKRNTNFKQTIERSISTPGDQKPNNEKQKVDETKTIKEEEAQSSNKFKTQSSSNIQIKRLSFERASLDSATRKIKTNEVKKTVEPPKITSKSVLERRMEIEQLTKSQIKTNQSVKKPQIAPKSVSTKMAFERSVSHNVAETKSQSVEKNIPSSRNSGEQNVEENVDLKGSWVKQVVNKFQ